jgi:hypothetical protein
MIKVCYFSETERRGARCIATGFHGRVSVMLDPKLRFAENALKAAQAYEDKFGDGLKVAFVGNFPCSKGGVRMYATSRALVQAFDELVARI